MGIGWFGRVACATTVLFSAAFATAQTTYRLDERDTWQATEQDEMTPAEAALERARRALASGRAERAATLATQWLERHENHPLAAQAHLIRADALFEQQEYYQSLFDYELIARRYTGSEVFVTALEREFEIARKFASGTKRKLWGMRIASAEQEAEELLIRIQERLPGSRLAEQAGIFLADYYFSNREMSLAKEMYSIFIENHPESKHLPRARRRLIYAYLADFKGPAFDASGLYDARALLQDLRRMQPLAAEQLNARGIMTRINEMDALKRLRTAQWYLKTGDPIAAELTLRRLIQRYPRTVAAGDAVALMQEQVLDMLPEPMRAELPDYKALRAQTQDQRSAGDAPTQTSPVPDGEAQDSAPNPADDEPDAREPES